MARTLVWFRDDLRVEDHPALTVAAEHAEEPGDVVGLYILDDTTQGIRPLGGASRWWLHHALESLQRELRELGVPLILRAGSPAELVPQLAEALSADRVHWSRRYGPGERALDAQIKQHLPERGIGVESFPGSLLHEPWTIQTNSGGPYKVFTPFYRALSSSMIREPGQVPEPLGGISAAAGRLSGAQEPFGELRDLDLLPTAPDWAGGLRDAWDPTIDGGHRRLGEFVESLSENYADGRDVPSYDSTSRMSPYLRFGQLSPFQIWDAAAQVPQEKSRRAFRSELGWREFCWHLLFHFPELPQKNLRSQFDAYPWQRASDEAQVFEAWTAGRTGFPFVDAGLRQLWDIGYMHNRVRMAAASLLIKNLGIDWRDGEAWFWDTLVDADAASNPANWQWVAGSGMDAAPYFRILNPERQRERFDPHDEYAHQWIPEFGTEDYPEPVVDLKASRAEALEHYQRITGA
ncbi:deoxyribodipyrimidine photo-lyase [Nesterenkonia sp. NBAIMH1]|uniref:cryptochrome/photolyase family protein n=1 Tax=Nesterenkonia sp. NBAIMH1 TaxID=2600320 RepID=UPI0011B7D00D|nr:deoxyribodipyrimidine photo-lyase [Nesterenkonia sp. NBAIMH1]